MNLSVNWHATVDANCVVRLLKLVVNEAAGEKTPEAYPLGYIEDFSRRERSWAPVSATDYRSRMAPCSTVICVTGSPEDFNSVRICSLR